MQERAVLSELANEEQATARKVARSLQMPDGEVQRMVERLTEVEVVEATNDSRHSAYRFQVELFRQWVERHTMRGGVNLEQARF
jgi:DNA-binding IclR family transcriptional regulator